VVVKATDCPPCFNFPIKLILQLFKRHEFNGLHFPHKMPVMVSMLVVESNTAFSSPASSQQLPIIAMKSLGQLLRPLFANASFAGFHLANMVLRDSQPILSPSNTTKAANWPPLLQLVILVACPGNLG
jgi:hypothetical protein